MGGHSRPWRIAPARGPFGGRAAGRRGGGAGPAGGGGGEGGRRGARGGAGGRGGCGAGAAEGGGGGGARPAEPRDGGPGRLSRGRGGAAGETRPLWGAATDRSVGYPRAFGEEVCGAGGGGPRRERGEPAR